MQLTSTNLDNHRITSACSNWHMVSKMRHFDARSFKSARILNNTMKQYPMHGETQRTDNPSNAMGRPLFIMHNLHQALWHSRYVNRPRYLWTDAISINQQNISERNAHVQLMASEYSKAFKVLLWLGTYESEAVDAAFEAFNRFQDFRVEDFRQQCRETGFRPMYRDVFRYVKSKGDYTIKIDRAALRTMGERLLDSPAF